MATKEVLQFPLNGIDGTFVCIETYLNASLIHQEESIKILTCTLFINYLATFSPWLVHVKNITKEFT